MPAAKNTQEQHKQSNVPATAGTTMPDDPTGLLFQAPDFSQVPVRRVAPQQRDESEDRGAEQSNRQRNNQQRDRQRNNQQRHTAKRDRGSRDDTEQDEHDETVPEERKRSEERRVGKEYRSRQQPKRER